MFVTMRHPQAPRYHIFIYFQYFVQFLNSMPFVERWFTTRPKSLTLPGLHDLPPGAGRAHLVVVMKKLKRLMLVQGCRVFFVLVIVLLLLLLVVVVLFCSTPLIDSLHLGDPLSLENAPARPCFLLHIGLFMITLKGCCFFGVFSVVWEQVVGWEG